MSLTDVVASLPVGRLSATAGRGAWSRRATPSC
jgi:hypothetical protein